MRFNHSICAVILLSLTSHALTATTASTTQPASVVYEQAGKSITVEGPSSNIKFVADFPPYPPQWYDLAEKAYKANGAARAMVRSVPPPPAGRWMDTPSADQHQLNETRHVANDIRDCATLAMLQGRPGEALDLLDDLDNMASVVRSQPKEVGGFIRLMVAWGIDAMRCDLITALAPRMKIGNEPDTVPADRVQKLIRRLLAFPPAQKDWEAVRTDAQASDLVTGKGEQPVNGARVIETFNRGSAMRVFAAMSLACQLYYADQGVWPESEGELVPAYLPAIPIDPWGDGKQTYGYRLDKAGRPDGQDRPLIFSRQNAKEGLDVTKVKPQYGYYTGDGSSPASKRAVGQFRDVSYWEVK